MLKYFFAPYCLGSQMLFLRTCLPSSGLQVSTTMPCLFVYICSSNPSQGPGTPGQLQKTTRNKQTPHHPWQGHMKIYLLYSWSCKIQRIRKASQTQVSSNHKGILSSAILGNTDLHSLGKQLSTQNNSSDKLPLRLLTT